MFPSGASIGLIEQMVENPGMPIRQPSVAIFTVDTADRYKNNADGFRVDTEPVNNIYISKKQSVINGYFTRVALTELNMPWNTPNVNARNNTFTVGSLTTALNPAPIEATVSVPEGFYTGEELATALEAALNAKMTALGSDYPTSYIWNVAFNITSGKFTVEAGDSFTIVPKNNGPRDDLLNMMGFGGLSVVADLSLPFETYVSGVASMLYTPYFDIVSQQLTKKQQVADSGTSYTTGASLLARIYLTPNDITETNFEIGQLGTAPFTIHREFRVPKQIYWDTKEFVNVIDLTLIDYKGNVLYEQPNVANGTTFTVGSGNANWQLTFQVSEI